MEYADSNDGVPSESSADIGHRQERRRIATVYDAVAGKTLFLRFQT